MKLTQIARQYAETDNPEVKSRLLEKAKNFCQKLDYSSYSRTKAEIGIAYVSAVNSSTKLAKGKKLGYNSLVLYLAAGNTSGLEICPFRSIGCSSACLMTSGKALMEHRSGRNRILASRIAKTWLAMYDRNIFHMLVAGEINKHGRDAQAQGKGFCMRLNGTSDLIFSSLWRNHPDVQFYDYTKNLKHALTNKRPNLHLTFSYSENNIEACKLAYAKGLNIALPVVKPDVAKALEHKLAYSMDTTDLRFLDPKRKRFGVLKAKTTDNTQAGIDKKFFLNLSQFNQAISTIQA